MRDILKQWDYNEYGYRFGVMQWKRVGPLVELVCELTEYEPDLERWNYRKKGDKSYDIQEGNPFGLIHVYYAKDLGVT